MASSQESKVIPLLHVFFFWIDALAWNAVWIPGIFRGSLHTCKNRRGSVPCAHSMVITVPEGIHPSLPLYLTPTFSQAITRMQDNTKSINLPSASSKFRHSLHTSQKTYLAFYYFYLKTINPSFLLWRSQQDLLSLLVPSAAIKRCRVSECDQLLHRGPATALENIQSSQSSWEPPTGLCQPPRAGGHSAGSKGHLWAERLPKTLLLAPGLWKQLGFKTGCVHSAQGWKEWSGSAAEIKKSKHLKLSVSTRLPWYHLWKDQSQASCSQRQRARHQQSISLPTRWHPTLTAKKKGSTETPAPQNLCVVSTWQSPGWCRAVSQVEHVRRCTISICKGSTYPYFTSLPASQESGKKLP